jgi:hypothetical protein
MMPMAPVGGGAESVNVPRLGRHEDVTLADRGRCYPRGMRSAVARRPPATRKVPSPRAVRAVAAPVARTSVAARAIQIAGATIAFLLAYAALTVLHAAGCEPRIVGALSPIPLFARIAASAILALLGGLGARLLPAGALRAVRTLLAVAIAVASIVILVCA